MARIASGSAGILRWITQGMRGMTAAMEKLLEDGEYTRARKRSGNVRNAVSLVYWLTATAVFLFYTFGPRGNGQPQYSWFIWAIAGVVFAAVMVVMKAARRKKQ